MQLQDVGLYLCTTFHLGHPIVYLTQNISLNGGNTMPMARYSVQHSRPTPTGHYIGQSDRLRLWTGQRSRLQERYTGNGRDPMPFPCVLLLESGLYAASGL